VLSNPSIRVDDICLPFVHKRKMKGCKEKERRGKKGRKNRWFSNIFHPSSSGPAQTKLRINHNNAPNLGFFLNNVIYHLTAIYLICH
jgi:hypothetical protein